MESRPWYKKLFGVNKGKEQYKGPVTTVREFPLPAPDTASRRAKPRKRGRRYRNPIIPQKVTDSRFNHALRPSHVARAARKSLAGFGDDKVYFLTKENRTRIATDTKAKL